MTPTPMNLVVSNVSKRFGSRTVLDRVNLTIHEGETVALIGPSGGGKTTLLRCLNGLTAFDEGEVRIGPHTLTPKSTRSSNDPTLRQVRTMLGMIFQDFRLFPHRTVLDNVIEAPVHVLKMPRAEAIERAMKLLAEVGMADRAKAYPWQLSGGQKQRVAIARAMCMGPRGLLCDEITSALDPEMKVEVLQAVERMDKEGQTLVMVTHEIGFARRAADRIVVLAGGTIIEDGPPEQVIDNSQNPRTRQFLSTVLA